MPAFVLHMSTYVCICVAVAQEKEGHEAGPRQPMAGHRQCGRGDLWHWGMGKRCLCVSKCYKRGPACFALLARWYAMERVRKECYQVCPGECACTHVQWRPHNVPTCACAHNHTHALSFIFFMFVNHPCTPKTDTISNRKGYHFQVGRFSSHPRVRRLAQAGQAPSMRPGVWQRSRRLRHRAPQGCRCPEGSLRRTWGQDLGERRVAAVMPEHKRAPLCSCKGSLYWGQA